MKNQNLLQKQIGIKQDTFYVKASNSVQSGQGGDNNLTNLDEENEDIEAQLVMIGRDHKPADTRDIHGVSKRLTDYESRQKIFEDEIIKRIKEIQRYTKSIHLQVKKGQ